MGFLNLITIARKEREFYVDDCMMAYNAMEAAKKMGNAEEEEKRRIEWEESSFWVDYYDNDIERIKAGAELRTDYKALSHVANEFNKVREKGKDYGLLPPAYTDDYGIDLPLTGVTAGGNFKVQWYEVKSVRSEKYDMEYLTKVAGRNRKCRYCDSASTFEEMERDTTPMPDYLKADTPIHVLNDTDKFGNTENAKINRILKANAGLILVFRDRMLVYSPKALKKAILGRIWIKVQHTTDFDDRKEQWERKVVIDLTAFSKEIKVETPPELL